MNVLFYNYSFFVFSFRNICPPQDHKDILQFSRSLIFIYIFILLFLSKTAELIFFRINFCIEYEVDLFFLDESLFNVLSSLNIYTLIIISYIFIDLSQLLDFFFLFHCLSLCFKFCLFPSLAFSQ